MTVTATGSSVGGVRGPSRLWTNRHATQSNIQSRLHEDRTERWRNLSTGMKLAALVQLVASLDAQPVYAIERYWKPRRHYRRLGEGNTSRPIWDSYGPRYTVQTPLQGVQSKHIQTSGKRTAVSSPKNVKKSPKVKELVLTAKNPGKQSVQGSESFRIPGVVSEFGSRIPPTARLMILAYLFFFLFTRLKRSVSKWMRRRPLGPHESAHGKWIRDRSLGGKEIFMASEGVDWNPLGEDNASLKSSRESPDNQTPLPSWWKSRAYIHVPEAKKTEGRKASQQIVRKLDHLRISGQDYSFDLILELYHICNDACISVKTASANIATSIYRYAVRHTVMLIAEGIGLSYNMQPVPFLCHLSEMLGSMSLDAAVPIVYSETATKLRAALLQTFADERSRGQDELSSGFAVNSVVRLLKTLPLRLEDAELIGSSITVSTTEEERIKVYQRFCNACPEMAQLFGKLLGKVEVQAMDE